MFCSFHSDDSEMAGEIATGPADMIFHRFYVEDGSGNLIYNYVGQDNVDGTYSLKDTVSGNVYAIPSVYTTDTAQEE